MTKKKLADVKAEVAALLDRLPGKSPADWLAKEMKSAKRDPDRDIETLEMLCAALKREANRRRKPKVRERSKR